MNLRSVEQHVCFEVSDGIKRIGPLYLVLEYLHFTWPKARTFACP